ncbi:hypothetical protein ACFQAT_25930 [Undibacterium arcticum]|uniref:P-type conjugative transfer protein TrbJ n=1 Tax=Undibacterium arcticum TaxID=1762892 RepID=A0ABV7F5B4_9BURK
MEKVVVTLKRVAIATMIMSVLVTDSAFGMASGSVVFDPANFSKNLVTAMEALKATYDRAMQLKTQYEQYRTQLAQLKGLSEGDLSSMRLRNQDELSNINGFIQSVNRTYGDVGQSRNLLQKRFDDQSAAQMSWKDYTESENASIKRGVESAKSRAAIDRQSLEKVNTDYDQVREWQGKIGNTAGMHEAMQLMNAQMNKVITQNGEVIKTMALNSMQKNNEDVDSLSNRQNEARMIKKRREEEAKRVHDANNRSRSELESWSKK